MSGNKRSCTLEFDGASKGNPGKSGAGAVLRANDGSEVIRFREGLGTQTNNAAEYKGLIRGMKEATSRGYEHIHVKGDSQLVVKQMQDEWKVKSPNLTGLHKEAKGLRDNFKSVSMEYAPRQHNTEADRQANQAVNLPAGHVEKDHEYHY